MRFAYRTAMPVLLVAALAACDRDNASETAQAPGAPLPASEPLTTERTIAPAPPTGNAELARAPQTAAGTAEAATAPQSAPDSGVATTAAPGASTAAVASASPEYTKAMDAAGAAGSQGNVGTTASPAASGVSGGTSATQYDAANARVMDKLLGASQQLREALQELAQQPSGTQRDQAMKEARQALYDTQQAMIRLPTKAQTQKQ